MKQSLLPCCCVVSSLLVDTWQLLKLVMGESIYHCYWNKSLLMECYVMCLLNRHSEPLLYSYMHTSWYLQAPRVPLMVSPHRAAAFMDDRYCTYLRRHRVSQWEPQSSKALVPLLERQRMCDIPHLNMNEVFVHCSDDAKQIQFHTLEARRDRLFSIYFLFGVQTSRGQETLIEYDLLLSDVYVLMSFFGFLWNQWQGWIPVFGLDSHPDRSINLSLSKSCLVWMILLSPWQINLTRRPRSRVWISCSTLAGCEHILPAEISHISSFTYFQNIHIKRWPTCNKILWETPEWLWCPAWTWQLFIQDKCVPRGLLTLAILWLFV